MPRKLRQSKLDSRSARLALSVRKAPYSCPVPPGKVALLYYRTRTKGTWSVRLYRGKISGQRAYVESTLGFADDYNDADEIATLTFDRAVALAQERASELRGGSPRRGPYTVADAIADYLKYSESRRKSYRDIKARLERHAMPALGGRLIDELTRAEIERWHAGLAAHAGYLRPKKLAARRRRRTMRDARARKVSANRELSYLKAALNHAWRRGNAARNDAWRLVEPFHGVEQARLQFLDAAEAQRLINACDPDFRPLVHAALVTGCRNGELTAMRVLDFDSDRGSVFIEKPKSSRARHVPLSIEGRELFEALTAGKTRDALIFTRADGQRWGRSDQTARMRAACTHAKIRNFVFHQLRHTFASHLAGEGVSMKVLAEIMGHSSAHVTERFYAHLADDTKRRAIALLPRFSEVSNPKVQGLRTAR